jgi:hypothetical protein
VHYGEVTVEIKLQELLIAARRALARMNSQDHSVGGVVDRVGALRYAEGTLVGFLDALVLTDPLAAQTVAPSVDGFISEAIAARILLD